MRTTRRRSSDRIAQAGERSFGERSANLLVTPRRVAGLRVVVQPVVGPPPRDFRFPRVVKQRREPDGERAVSVRRRLDDCERVLVYRQRVVAALLVEPDRRLELGKELHEDAGVARDRERLRRMRSEQQLRKLAHPVGRDAPTDALARHETNAGRVAPHLLEGLGCSVEVEL